MEPDSYFCVCKEKKGIIICTNRKQTAWFKDDLGEFNGVCLKQYARQHGKA